jgi:hypothetical protein
MGVRFSIALAGLAMICVYTGCTKISRISVEECRTAQKPQIVGLITTSGYEIALGRGYCELSTESFLGIDAHGSPLLVRADSVAAVEVRRLDKLRSIAAAVVVVSVVATVQLLLIRAAYFGGW